MRHFGSS